MAQPKPPLDAGNPTFTIDTSAGTMTGQLFPKHAPESVANFARYAKDGFYQGLIFHRVIKGFMIQGGGFDASGGRKETRPPIRLETSSSLAHWNGALALARTSAPGSATSQFYVCHGPQTGLDGNYAVFGLVTSGLEVVDRIATVRTGREDKPVEDVVIRSVTVQGA